MSMTRDGHFFASTNPLPFNSSSELSSGEDVPPSFDLTFLPDTARDVLGAIDGMSRRIDELARELGCLGFFEDDDDDGPRAA